MIFKNNLIPKNFEEYISEKSEADILKAEAEKESIEELTKGMEETESGLKYKISKNSRSQKQ